MNHAWSTSTNVSRHMLTARRTGHHYAGNDFRVQRYHMYHKAVCLTVFLVVHTPHCRFLIFYLFVSCFNHCLRVRFISHHHGYRPASNTKDTRLHRAYKNVWHEHGRIDSPLRAQDETVDQTKHISSALFLSPITFMRRICHNQGVLYDRLGMN